jgi:hypothetical protein
MQKVMDDPIVRIVLPIPTNMVKDALTQRELLLRVVQSLFEVKRPNKTCNLDNPCE